MSTKCESCNKERPAEESCQGCHLKRQIAELEDLVGKQEKDLERLRDEGADLRGENLDLQLEIVDAESLLDLTSEERIALFDFLSGFTTKLDLPSRRDIDDLMKKIRWS